VSDHIIIEIIKIKRDNLGRGRGGGNFFFDFESPILMLLELKKIKLENKIML